VAISCGQSRVIGFYTLVAGVIVFRDQPVGSARKLPRHPVPVVLLARLAVDLSAQGRRLGEGLHLDALPRSLELSQSLELHAFEVDAIDEAAACFYLKYSLVRLQDPPNRLVLPLAVNQKLLGASDSRPLQDWIGNNESFFHPFPKLRSRDESLYHSSAGFLLQTGVTSRMTRLNPAQLTAGGGRERNDSHELRPVPQARLRHAVPGSVHRVV
jgi:hypothetical protein